MVRNVNIMLFYFIYFCYTKKTIHECITIINTAYANETNTNKIYINIEKNYENEIKVLCIKENIIVVELIEHDLVLKRIMDKYNNAREDTISTNLSHENIITTYMSFRQKINGMNVIWLVMESFLANAYQYFEKLDVLQKLSLCMDLCNAMKYLKTKNIVYLDIKLDNIGVKTRNKIVTDDTINAIIQLYNYTQSQIQNNQYYNTVLYNKHLFESKGQSIKYKKTEKNCNCNHILNEQDSSVGNDYIFVLFDFGLSKKYNYDINNKIILIFSRLHYIAAPELVCYQSYNYKTDVYNFGLLCVTLFFPNIEIPKTTDDNNIMLYENEDYKAFIRMLKQEVYLITNIILNCIIINVNERYDVDQIEKKLQVIRDKQNDKEMKSPKKRIKLY